MPTKWPHGKGAQSRSPISYDTIPLTPLSSGSAIRSNTIPTQPRSAGNPFARDTKSPASSNPYSQESQRKFGNAIAMVAHAIGEGARAFSEGTSYESKPPILQWAASNPETLQIRGCTADGSIDPEALRPAQSGTETNISSVRRPPPARAPTFPKSATVPPGSNHESKRSKVPRRKITLTSAQD